MTDAPIVFCIYRPLLFRLRSPGHEVRPCATLRVVDVQEYGRKHIALLEIH